MATVGDFLGRVLINNMSSCVSGLRTSGACQHMYTVCMYYCLSMFLSPLLSLFFPFLPPSSMSPSYECYCLSPLSSSILSLSSSHCYFLPAPIISFLFTLLFSPCLYLTVSLHLTLSSPSWYHSLRQWRPCCFHHCSRPHFPLLDLQYCRDGWLCTSGGQPC